MAANEGPAPSETSPLLARPIDHHDHHNALERVTSHPIDPSGGIVPEGADPYDPAEDEDEDGEAAGDGADLERQRTTDSRRKVDAGVPEAKERLRYILPAIAIGVFLSAADQTIIVSSYGIIGTDLNALNKTSWIATAYLLTLTSFQPLYGKLSDIFGRKACLLFAYTIFGLGALFCGLARNMNELIGARAFAGIGGGGMTTIVSILLSDLVPLRERGKWQGYINTIYAAGAGAGAPIGGILADHVGWRWAFLAQAPLCLLAFLSVHFLLDLPKQDQSHWKDKIRRIDFLGAGILICAVFLLLLGLDRGSNVSWRSPLTLASILTAVPLFGAFVLVEMYVAAEPFAPGHLIFSRALVACYACNFFAFAGWLATTFYAPLYFQAVGGVSATRAGVLLIPNILTGVSGSLFGGFYMQRTGRYYWLTVTAYACLVAGVLVVTLCAGGVVASTPGMVLGLMVCGFANGIGVTTTLIGLIGNAAHADQAVVTACSYLFRSLGCVFGVSVSATVANQLLRASLRRALGSGDEAEEITRHVRQSLSWLDRLSPELKKVVVDCYAKSTRAAFLLQMVLVAGAAIAAWAIREKRLK